MKYIKTIEGFNWFKRLKNPKEVINSVLDIDKDKELNKKISNSIKKINILGSNFTEDAHKNLHQSKIYYTSKIDLNVPIKGCIETKLQLKKDNTNNLVTITISMIFDKDSDVNKVADGKRQGLYLMSKNRITGQSSVSKSDVKRIDYESTEDEIKDILVSMINKLINVDFKDIQETIKKIEEDIAEKNRIENEYINKLVELRNKMDELSDYLFDLEEMSIAHHKEFKDNKIVFIYHIPGIKVGKSNGDTAKLVINDTILEVMSIIKTFIKRSEKEIEGVIVKSNFSDSKIVIRLSLQNGDQVATYLDEPY